MSVDYIMAHKVPVLNGLGEWIWSVKVPVGAIWKLLLWKKKEIPLARSMCATWIKICAMCKILTASTLSIHDMWCRAICFPTLRDLVPAEQSTNDNEACSLGY